MVIVDVVFQQSSQVPLVQNDHVVEQIATHTSDPTLGDAVLPGTAKSSPDRFCAVLFDGRDDVSRELGIAVEAQKPGWRFVPPSFAQLQYDPQGIWLTGHIAVQNLPPIVADDEEAGSKIASLMPDLLKVGLGIQGFGVSGSSAECAVA